MSKQPNFGKSLSGYTPLGPQILATLGDEVSAVMSEGLVLQNVSIQGGTINGVSQGNSNPGPVYTTNFYSGQPGTGYQSCFYGDTPGQSACWDPITGTWGISGNLTVTLSSSFGNLKILNNTLSSTNTNGNIFVTPTGTGIIYLDGPITQSTSVGNLTFNTLDGLYSLETTLSNTLKSGKATNINTTNGDIKLTTGLGIPVSVITAVSSGISSIDVTTSTSHNLIAGDKITITGTNNGADGIYTISTLISATKFTVPVAAPIVSSGTTGSVKRHNNIYLTASNNIIIPQNVKTTYGGISNLYNDGSNMILDTGTGNFTINGKLIVNGPQTYITSTVVSIDDPVFNVGGINAPTVTDNMDRGISGKYFNGSAKTVFFGRSRTSGCFTYIPDATEVSSNVFTGTAGCAVFGNVTSSGITLTGGTITGLTTLSVPTLSTCNLACTGTMSITGTTGISLVSPLVTTSGNFTATGTIQGTSATITNNITSGSSTVTGNTTTGTFNTTTATVSGTLNACNINCSGTMTITGATGISLVSPLVTTSNNFTATGTIQGASATITNNITSGSSTVIGNTTTGSLNVTTNATILGTTTTNALNVTTNATILGTTTTNDLNVNNNAHIYNNLTVDGTSNLKVTNATTINATSSITAPVINSTTTANVVDLNITGTVTGLPFVGLTTEHLNVLGGNIISPSATTNMTFINITSSGTATGVLPNGTSDGMQKYIFISSAVSGGQYKLSASSNLIDIGTGTTASKVLTFETAGYSIFLIWDNIKLVWLFVNAGVCIAST
jgi:hypothetical protein